MAWVFLIVRLSSTTEGAFYNFRTLELKAGFGDQHRLNFCRCFLGTEENTDTDLGACGVELYKSTCLSSPVLFEFNLDLLTHLSGIIDFAIHLTSLMSALYV